ncbi:MAG: HPF/RaiA family ribosome-associated protein [Bacteriovorax sp.]|nr:HPF/RaiA family ribosome-associated protein [Bacteriovorax sp.]
MQIQISTDHNIKGTHEFQTETEKFEEIVKVALGHFEKHITRVEVHFSDINAGKTGYEDKRCLIEARVSGVQPIIATNNANNLLEALEGATERLKHSLEHTFGKMKQH